MSSRLEKATNVAVILAASVFIGTTLYRLVPERRNAPAPGAEIGAPLDLKGVPFSQTKSTLLLVLRSTCVFCTASMPLYREIMSERSPATLRMIAVGAEPTETMRGYLKQHGVTVDDVFTTHGNPLSIIGTPTLLLVDKNGILRHQWIGRLPDAKGRQVLDIIRGRTVASN
jgi:thioredoxin-related protein